MNTPTKERFYTFIDTHAHLDGPEYDADRDDVMARARQAGVSHVFVPAISLDSARTVLSTCARYPGFAWPMVGLHPEEVKTDWRQQLDGLYALLTEQTSVSEVIAIGEVGLDFYWDRQFEKEQLLAFERQVEWSVETGLPLMIHCRKAQNELVRVLRRYEHRLPGGVFHCFTGNAQEAAELLRFERFVLGIGGVLTFKKSPLPAVLPAHVPLSRIVLETDAPYMAPVPLRGQRNESAYVAHVLDKLADAYGVMPAEVASVTTQNVCRVFGSRFSTASEGVPETN